MAGPPLGEWRGGSGAREERGGHPSLPLHRGRGRRWPWAVPLSPQWVPSPVLPGSLLRWPPGTHTCQPPPGQEPSRAAAGGDTGGRGRGWGAGMAEPGAGAASALRKEPREAGVSSPPPPQPGGQGVSAEEGRREEGAWVPDALQLRPQLRPRGGTSSPSLPPASPSPEPLDGCVSTDSELIKPYLSSAVDTEPPGLAGPGMCVFLHAYRKRSAPAPECAHPAPLLPLEPPQVHAGLARSPRPDGAGAGAAGAEVAGSHSFGPTPQHLGAGSGRPGQEESGEVIITCLSFSSDV